MPISAAASAHQAQALSSAQPIAAVASLGLAADSCVSLAGSSRAEKCMLQQQLPLLPLGQLPFSVRRHGGKLHPHLGLTAKPGARTPRRLQLLELHDGPLVGQHVGHRVVKERGVEYPELLRGVR